MNKIAAKITAASLLLCIRSTAYADINMMEASFKTSFIDLQTETTPTAFKISRTYDSHSTYSGLFGFGWCSNLDASIVREFGKVSVRECGVLASASLVTDRESYIRKKFDGTLQRFSVDDGRLTGITLPGHTEVRILRARRGLPQAAAAEEGVHKRRQVLLELDDSGRVTRIESAGPDPGTPSPTSRFTYSSEGNLLAAKNSWNNTYVFGYDRLHNLTQVSYPDRTFEKLTYDADHDRVTSFQGRNGCKENYNHEFKKSNPAQTSLKQTSVATLSCPGEATTHTRFDFHYAKRADQRWALAKLRLTTAEGKIQILNYKLGGLQ